MEKQGIESYHKPTAVVVGEQSYKKYDDAQDSLDNYKPGTLITPAKKFNLTSDNNNFLYEPDGIHPDGDWWVVNHRYIHSETGWDTDIYKIG